MQPKPQRIVFMGPMGIGKTTAIRTLCGELAIDCDAPNLDKASHAKDTTTVGADFGEIQLAGSDTLQIYGCPGQERFSFVRSWVLSVAFAAVVMVDITDPGAHQEACRLALECEETPSILATAILISRPASDDAMEAFGNAISEKTGLTLPILSADPRNRQQMLDVLGIIAAMLPSTC